MKIHSSKGFRHWYKEFVKQYPDNDLRHDEDFIGCTLRDNDGRILKSGFFEMYHGDKDEVEKFLPSILDIAEDDQAVYEFLQNAVDCGSTHFYAFYTDEYFLVINNGKQFERDGIKAILNIAQSDKHDENLIGRLGIGFKLVHRLVGKNDGSEELVHDMKGPSVFSWSKLSDLKSLVEDEELDWIDDDAEDNGLPYLFKIICTNFPASPGEKVFGLNGVETIPFELVEFQEMRAYVNKCLKEINGYDMFNSGTLFFIKLGEGKRDLLDRNHDDLRNGIQFSMNMLKNLKYVRINDTLVEKTALRMEIGKIGKNELSYNQIAAKTDNDINFAVGYCDVDYNKDEEYLEVDKLRNSPNFYKFFPMGDECHKFALLIHSDSFNFESNRRKLHDDATNRMLLREIALFLNNKLNEYRNNGDKDAFLKLYASILYCDQPHDNSKWLKDHFTELLMEHLRKCIPTTDGYCDDATKVKVCQIRTPVNLSDIGLSDYHWFAFNTTKLVGRSNSGSGLRTVSWDIVDLIANAEIEDINVWINSRDKDCYSSFVKELDNALNDEKKRSRISEKLKRINLFSFNDGNYYSYYKIVKRKHCNSNSKLGELVYSTKKLFRTSVLNPIADDLLDCGLCISDIAIDDYPNLAKIFVLPKIKEMQEWLKNNDVFYSSKLLKDGDNSYQHLQEALMKLFKLHVPCVESLKLTENWRALFEDDCNVCGENISIKGDKATEEEILSLIDFCQRNNESFFDRFVVVEDEGKTFALGSRDESLGKLQYYAKGRLAALVNEHLSNMYPLPKFLHKDEIKTQKGILNEEDLQLCILELPNFDEMQHEFAFVVMSKFRVRFLEKLHKFTIDIDKDFEKDCYEYRILDMACKSFAHKSNDQVKIGNFMDKVVVVRDGKEYELSTELLGERDEFELNGHKFLVSEILPNANSEAGIVDRIIDTFSQLGLDRKELTDLLNVNEDVDIDELFKSLKSKVKVLNNAQQLGFALEYSKDHEGDLSGFKVLALDNTHHDLETGYFYDCMASFLPKSSMLSWVYKGLGKYVDLPSGNVLDGPYIYNNKMIFPSFSKKEWNDEKSEEFLDIIYNKWLNNQSLLEGVDLQTIYVDNISKGSLPISNLLGFSFLGAVHSDRYAQEQEKLPAYVEEWIQDTEDGLLFMKNMGVSVEDTPMVMLRKYLYGDELSFDKKIIYQCSEDQLYRTLDWFSNKMLKALDDKMLRVIEDIVDKLSNYNDYFKLSEDYNFNELDRNAKEWNDDSYKSWHLETGLVIKLYSGKMPRNIIMNNRPIYNIISEEDYCCEKNTIFINDILDIRETLQAMALSKRFNILDMNKLSVLVNNDLVITKSKLQKIEHELEIAKKRIIELERELSTYKS